jgi:hypothetical protein
MEGTTAPFTRDYKPMLIEELKVVKKYLEEYLGKGFI